MPLQTGARLGPYEVLSALGSGGMGQVFKARDTRLDRTVAIKVLPEHISHRPEIKARFEREAQILAKLNHPHICSVFDVGEQDGVDYLVMEYVEGETLEGRLAKGRLQVDQAIRYAIDIADALAAAHRAGITHRDLKPANVILAKSGPKLLDFGLAKTQPAASFSVQSDAPTVAPTLTTEGAILGTVQYMSPEQVEGKEADARTDIFAFGATLYEMVTGKKAFTGKSHVSLLAAILDQEPQPMSALQSMTPAALEHLVRRCLLKDPELRWQSVQDISHELQWIMESQATPVAAASPVASPPRRKRAAWAIAGVVGVVLIAAAFWAGRSTSPEPVTERTRFEPKTFEPQTIFNARFAPDGETIVFSSAIENTVPELFVLRPGSVLPQKIGKPRMHLLSISSKGEMAVLTDAQYLESRLFSGTLARMTLDGEPRPWLQQVREADWSPDGSTLAIVRVAPGKDQLEYPIGKVLYETPGYVSDLRVSPDGSRVAFMDHPAWGDNRGWIKVVDASGRVTTLGGEYQGEEGVAWSPDGQTLYFSAIQGVPDYQMFGVSLRLPAVREVLPSAGPFFVLDVSRNGRWLALQQDMEVSIRALLPGAAEEREFRWLDQAWTPELSRDGKFFVFGDSSHSAGPNYAVAMRRTDGSPAVRLGDGTFAGLSPDGRWALGLFYKPARVRAYPTGPGETAHLNSGQLETYPTFQGSWFPDSRRVVLCGNEPLRAPRCYVHDLSGSAPTPIAGADGATRAIVSPDGRLIAAKFTDNTTRVWALDGGQPQIVPALTADDDLVAWTSDNAAVLISTRLAPPKLERFELKTGKRIPLRITGPPDRRGLVGVYLTGVLEDGKYYAYSYERLRGTLYLISRDGDLRPQVQ